MQIIKLSECVVGHYYWFELEGRKRFPGQLMMVENELMIRTSAWIYKVADLPIKRVLDYGNMHEHRIVDFMNRVEAMEPLQVLLKVPQKPRRSQQQVSLRRIRVWMCAIAVLLTVAIILPLLVYYIDPLLIEFMSSGAIDTHTKVLGSLVLDAAVLALGIAAALFAVDCAAFFVRRILKWKD